MHTEKGKLVRLIYIESFTRNFPHKIKERAIQETSLLLNELTFAFQRLCILYACII